MFAVLAAALVLFVWGRWRYDLVALFTLLVLVVPGIVPADRAFLGFGHPAVVTVAAVLVISRALASAGLVDRIAGWLSFAGDRFSLQLLTLTLVVAVASAFMNNVGALALFMPVAIRLAREHERPASLLLMPIAFASLLGGLVTLIGTPPNIIIATYRGGELGQPFRMFDFAPVGASVAAAGVLLIALAGWRLLPRRRGEADPARLFETEEYLVEIRVPAENRWAGRSLEELGQEVEGSLTVLGIVRRGRRIAMPSPQRRLREGDVLLVEAEPDELGQALSDTGLEAAGTRELQEHFLDAEDVRAAEGVVRPDTRAVGKNARELALRSRYRVNLLGVARHGERVRGRIGKVALRPGDVLLLQGEPEGLGEAMRALGLLPLATRGLAFGRPRGALLSTALFAGAIGLTVTELLPVHISLSAAALALVLTGPLSIREAYESIDWPVIILLGAMLPVGEALERTGGAGSIADLLITTGEALSPAGSVGVLLLLTMLLSNMINNAAAAVLLAPVGVGVAAGLGASADPFLMAIAVGASSAFLTPIGHQSNTLVMGPGGYRFGDYLYLGLPVSALVLALSVPLILWVWPL